MDGKDFALLLGKRGRNRSAPPKLRLNGYRDEHGRYQLSDGLQPWHERVVDWMLANPQAKIKDVAEAFNVTPQWMGQLLKTDAFRVYYNERMETHRQEVHQQVVHKLQAVTTAALDGMQEKLQEEDVSFNQLRESAELGLKGLGYTGHGAGGVNINLNGNGTQDQVVSVRVSSSALERAREAWKKKIAETDGEEEDEARHERHRYVTSSLEATLDEVEVEDAVVLDDPADDA